MLLAREEDPPPPFGRDGKAMLNGRAGRPPPKEDGEGVWSILVRSSSRSAKGRSVRARQRGGQTSEFG